MKKRDVLTILVLVVSAVAFLVTMTLLRNRQTVEPVMEIYVDGALYGAYPLQEGERVTVHQADGSENVICMTKDGFYMQSANCHDHLCQTQGTVTLGNWTRRKLGAQVICLPNRVLVTLRVEQNTPSDDIPDV